MPKKIAPITIPVRLPVAKKATVATPKQRFRITRRSKKFMRSNRRPQNGLNTSRTRLGIVTVRSATRSGV